MAQAAPKSVPLWVRECGEQYAAASARSQAATVLIFRGCLQSALFRWYGYA